MYLYCKVSRKTLLVASVLVSRPSPHRTHPAIPRGRSIRPLLQFMPFLLCSAKPTEHLFICVMVSTVADPPPDYGKLNKGRGVSRGPIPAQLAARWGCPSACSECPHRNLMSPSKVFHTQQPQSCIIVPFRSRQALRQQGRSRTVASLSFQRARRNWARHHRVLRQELWVVSIKLAEGV